MTIERLNDILKDSLDPRFKILYGLGVNDVFINQQCLELKIEEALFEELKYSNYECIIFFSPHKSLYFFDEASAQFCKISNQDINKGAKVPDNGSNLTLGPLENLSMFPTKKPSHQTNKNKGMGDLHAIRILDAIMHNDGPQRAAVVFLQSETIFKYFDDPRTLAGLIGEWNRLSSHNHNSCFLVFSLPDLNSLVDSKSYSSIPEIISLVQSVDPIAKFKSGIYNIGTPRLDEIDRLLLSFINEQPINILERELETLARKMFAEGRQIREWKKLIVSTEELSLKHAIQNYWFPKTQTSIKPIWERLDELVGLGSVKNRIKEISAWIQLLKNRGEFDLNGDSSPSLHMIFTGNPGTGKTTIARLFGEIFQELGILARGHLVEARASDLIADYVGGTAIKTNDLINQALDGVLFIDEAYTLTQDERGKFGIEALETLLNRLEDDRHRLVVIAAGYPGLMDKFRQANPGLSRRFPAENIIYFEDFDCEELWKILEAFLNKKQIYPVGEIRITLEQIVRELYLRKDIHFGNAGEIRNLAEAIDRRRSSRLIFNDSQQGDLVIDDIPPLYRDLLPEANVSARIEFMTKLNRLIGLHEVKDRLGGMINLQEYESKKNSLLKNQNQKVKFKHLIFSGNAGTGKTTVARLIGEFYKSLGILSRGHLVEVSRFDLVAGYVGQSGLKTVEKLKSALDGVLFIDEAYSLIQGGENDFGKEVINALISFMETHQGRILIIVAGYPIEMKSFVEQNPGLLSRFSPEIHFKDFSIDELIQVFLQSIESEGLIINQANLIKVRKFIEYARLREKRMFGNARFVLNLVEIVKINLAKRVIPTLDVTHENEKILLLTTIESEDIPEPESYMSQDS